MTEACTLEAHCEPEERGTAVDLDPPEREPVVAELAPAGLDTDRTEEPGLLDIAAYPLVERTVGICEGGNRTACCSLEVVSRA